MVDGPTSRDTLRALIFDFDGLIMDTESAAFQSWSEVYAEHGCTAGDEVWSKILGGSGKEWDHIGYLETQTGRKLDGEAIRRRRFARKLALMENQTVLPGILEYLDTADAYGLKTAVVSSSPHAWVDGLLERLGLTGRFEVVLCSEDVREVKPDPELYLVALARLGIAPEEAIVFEDSNNGIQAARAAGIRSIAVPNPVTALLPMDGADIVVNSLADLPFAGLLDRLKLTCTWAGMGTEAEVLVAHGSTL